MQRDVTQSARLPRASGGITRLACDHLQKAGIAVGPLLEKAGVPFSFYKDRDTRLTVASQIRFLNEAAIALSDDHIGFHLAQNFDLGEVGLLYYVMASSGTLGEGLRRAERYSGITNEAVSITRIIDGDSMRLRFAYSGIPRRDDRHQVEFWMTALIRACRTLTGSVRPRMVQFAHRACGASKEMERYYGCELVFGSAVDELTFELHAGGISLRLADPYLNSILVGYCEEALASRRPAKSSVRAEVENAMVPLLPHGRPLIGTVARRLGMSTRTLARLAADGATFGRILDELRADLAQRYLAENDLSMSKIAWLLGFQEVSAFTHACRRWTDKTPTEIRAGIP